MSSVSLTILNLSFLASASNAVQEHFPHHFSSEKEESCGAGGGRCVPQQNWNMHRRAPQFWKGTQEVGVGERSLEMLAAHGSWGQSWLGRWPPGQPPAPMSPERKGSQERPWTKSLPRALPRTQQLWRNEPRKLVGEPAGAPSTPVDSSCYPLHRSALGSFRSLGFSATLLLCLITAQHWLALNRVSFEATWAPDMGQSLDSGEAS